MNGTQYWFNSDLIEVHRKPSQRTSHFFKVVSDGQWDMVGKFEFWEDICVRRLSLRVISSFVWIMSFHECVY